MSDREYEEFSLEKIGELREDTLRAVIAEAGEEWCASAAAQELLRRKEKELDELRQSRPIKSLAAWRGEIDALFDSLADADVTSYTVHRPVKEIDPIRGWRNWECTGDVIVSIHLRQEPADAE